MEHWDSTPIFVVGSGRSGSTVFFDMLARHRGLCWPSRLSHDYPHKPWINELWMRLRTVPGLRHAFEARLGPSEAYPFWDYHCPGFSNPYRDLQANDVTTSSASRLRQAVARMSLRTGRRFVAKITGWPRVRFLHTIFPSARFIEVKREPAATVASLLEVHFWDGWRGPPCWRRGPLPPALEEIWKAENESFVALAAIEYVVVETAMAVCRAAVPKSQFLTVTYADLCTDPIAAFAAVLEFCDLESSAFFTRSIRSFRLKNQDQKWRQTLSPQQQRVLIRTIEKASAAVHKQFGEQLQNHDRA